LLTAVDFGFLLALAERAGEGGDVSPLMSFRNSVRCLSSPRLPDAVRPRYATGRPSTPPELLSAGALELPADCAAAPVRSTESGTRERRCGVDHVASAEGPPWRPVGPHPLVSTFRDAPGSAPADSTSLDGDGRP